MILSYMYVCIIKCMHFGISWRFRLRKLFIEVGILSATVDSHCIETYSLFFSLVQTGKHTLPGAKVQSLPDQPGQQLRSSRYCTFWIVSSTGRSTTLCMRIFTQWFLCCYSFICKLTCWLQSQNIQGIDKITSSPDQSGLISKDLLIWECVLKKQRSYIISLLLKYGVALFMQSHLLDTFRLHLTCISNTDLIVSRLPTFPHSTFQMSPFLPYPMCCHNN